MSPHLPLVEQITSSDGTRIGFDRIGSGPGLVLVQGAMGTAYSFRQLAESLADTFTVIVPDRRGRGRSPRSFSPAYTVADDVADLEAVLDSTGARLVFGLSSGGDIALTAALTLPAIERLALFEPALFLDGVPTTGIERFERYVAADDVEGMLTTGMKIAQLGPAFLRRVPDRLVKRAVGAIIRAEEKSGTGDYAPMSELGRAFPYDFAVVRATSGPPDRFDAVACPVLLLGGSRSPAYLGRAIRRLEKVLPDNRTVILEGLDHGAAWNIDRRRNPHGNPTAVASELRRFFTS